MIRIQLLGNPQVHIDQQQITFPYKKAETIFYYIATHKSVSRSQLINIFWPDTPELNAKKNLRDALYKIRKSFGMDIVTSTKKTSVEFSCSHDFILDVDALEKGDLSVYKGDYLNGIFIKGNEDYDNYLEEQRRHYFNIFRNTILTKEYILPELIEKALLVDPLDELMVRKYMSLMMAKQDYTKALEAYQRLEKVLDEELMIEPEKTTIDLYFSILDTRQEDAIGNDVKIFGRQKELGIAKELLRATINNQYHPHQLYIGEAGIGKSTFLDMIRDESLKQGFMVFSFDCYQAEQQFTLKPWHQVLDQVEVMLIEHQLSIPDRWIGILHHLFPRFMKEHEHENLENIERIDSLKSQLVLEAIVGIFNMLSETKPIIFFVEDIHWMDSFSLELLSNLILHHSNQRFVTVMSMRSDYHNKLDPAIRSLLAKRRIQQISLESFNFLEAKNYLSFIEPNKSFTESDVKRALEITGGNPLFLREWGKLSADGNQLILTSNDILGIIDSRLLDLQADDILVLEGISIFFKKATLEELSYILSMDDMELLLHLETLKNRLFIEELEVKNDIFFKISHQYIHDYLYQQLSKTRKMIWHRRYVSYLEERMQPDHNNLHLTSLMVHADAGHEPLKALNYALMYYHYYSELNYELFPSISSNNSQGMNRFSALHAFEYIDYYAKKVPNLSDHPKLWMEYWHLKGRYEIKEGNHEEGKLAIEKVLNCASEYESQEFLFKGYVQMIYYGIQTHDMETLREYVSIGFSVAMTKGERATLYRLKGLFEILTAQYEMASKSLDESLALQHESQLATIMNEAAIYNYKGDLAICLKDYPLAISHYKHAISSLKDRDILRGLTLFYGNLGQAYYLNGDYVKAKKALLTALAQYDQFNIHWKRSMVSGYMALIAFEENHYDEANFHLHEAEKAFGKMKNPLEARFLQEVKTKITDKRS